MPNPLQAALAYAASSAHRSPREQEAEVFRRANAALRQARGGGERARVRALADNDRLWLTVLGLVVDPDNALPEATRAGIASIGAAVRREMRGASPDLEFLISVNENFAAGLGGSLP